MSLLADSLERDLFQLFNLKVLLDLQNVLLTYNLNTAFKKKCHIFQTIQIMEKNCFGNAKSEMLKLL